VSDLTALRAMVDSCIEQIDERDARIAELEAERDRLREEVRSLRDTANCGTPCASEMADVKRQRDLLAAALRSIASRNTGVAAIARAALAEAGLGEGDV